MKFLLGLLVGVLLGAGGTWWALRHEGPAEVAVAVDAGPPPPPEPTGKKRRRRGGGSGGATSPEGPIVLGPGDLKTVAQGDSLARGARTVDLGAAGEVRDLEQHEIDGAVARRADAITRCITSARGEAELSGRITASFLVSPAGKVTKTRVEAPAYLMGRGLAPCVRRELAALSFPATGKESVVTVPFDLE